MDIDGLQDDEGVDNDRLHIDRRILKLGVEKHWYVSDRLTSNRDTSLSTAVDRVQTRANEGDATL